MMRRLRRFLDAVAPLFEKGGRLHHLSAVYEMFDTFFYSPADVTRSAPHVRDAVDFKRVMMTVYFAVMPCFLVAMFQIGFEINNSMHLNGLTIVPGWRAELLDFLGIGFDPKSVWACLSHGALYVLPIYIVTFVVGIAWEVLFAVLRNHEVNEGFMVTSILFALTLPASIPLWQVALGISFGVVLGKEVFGGVGKNFLNPALVGRAFLFFAYPAQMSGDAVWVPVDSYSGATPLALWSEHGASALQEQHVTWTDAFLGFIPGSMGETSVLACLVGAAILLFTRVASARIMLGVLAGMLGTSLLFNWVGSDDNYMFNMPWYWHFVLGGFAFGTVFMATDPVSAAMTNTGKWFFGILIGVMTCLIRVINPAYTEGMMLAILFANVFAPLIDWFVVQANIRKRSRNYV